MRTVDLFCGCGGLSLGLARAGYDVVAALDNWKPALDVYEANFPNDDVYQHDLSDVDGTVAIVKKYAPDIIVGGPPCQDFSSAGARDSSRGRANLTPDFASTVIQCRPKWFIMENVPDAQKSPIYQESRRKMEAAGYGTTLMVLDASLCGVPQKRKRLILIGELGGQTDALAPFLTASLAETRMTVRDHLGKSLGLEHYYRHPRNYNRRGIYSIDEPSATVRGVNRPVPKGYPGHHLDTAPVTDELRPLTTIERSYIQTFPKTFQFFGPKTHLEQMIGNAVPVNLAEFVGRAVLAYQDSKKPPPKKRKK